MSFPRSSSLRERIVEMISTADFAFTIGFDASQAVVDRSMRRKLGDKSTKELFDASLYRAAFAAAVASGKDSEIQEFIDAYNDLAHSAYKTKEQFARLFGVYVENTSKVKRL
jgi:hypothetical protein